MIKKERKHQSVIEPGSDDRDFMTKLVVGIGEVSLVTGIPQRQLRYWQQKGIIKTVPEPETSTRRFTCTEIKKILLIKELLDEGYTLEAAANKISNRITRIDEIFRKLKKQGRL